MTPKGKGAGYQHKAQKGKIDFTPGRFRAPVFNPADRMFLGPDGKVYPRSVVEDLNCLFTECVLAPITPPKKICIMDSNPPMPDEERESIMARFGPEGVEIIPYEPSEMSPLGEPSPPTLKATLVEDTSISSNHDSFDGDTSNPSWNAPSSGMGDISGVSSLPPSSDEGGPGPVGNDSMMDYDFIFLAKRVNYSRISTISTDSSARENNEGETSYTSLMEL